MHSLNVISTEYNVYTIDRLVPSFWQTPFPPSFAHSLWLSFRDRSEHQTYEAMEHHHFLGKSSNEVGHVPLPKGILNGRFPKWEVPRVIIQVMVLKPQVIYGSHFKKAPNHGLHPNNVKVPWALHSELI